MVFQVRQLNKGQEQMMGPSVTMLGLQFNYVRVPEKLQVLDLPSDLPDHIKASDLLPVEYLHSDFMSSQFMFAHCRRSNFNMSVPGLAGNILWCVIIVSQAL